MNNTASELSGSSHSVGASGGSPTVPALAFSGNRFVGASWRPDTDPSLVRRLRAATAGWALAEGPGWLLASEKRAIFAQRGPLSATMGRDSAFDRDAATLADANAVVRGLGQAGVTALDAFAPPFRAAWSDANNATVHGHTDAVGLGHVFVCEGRGYAILSSSATLLANLLGATLSSETLAAFAYFGGFLARETPFADINKLPAGASAILSDGRVTIVGREARPLSTLSVKEAFTNAVAALLKAVPDAELELSGGLDSRLILAAMSSDQRRGRKAITIGLPSEPSEDVCVARELATTERLDWSLLDAGGVATLDSDALAGLLNRASIGYDNMANPLDKAALILFGSGRSVHARFGGQNGEILRGFYYAGQPLHAAPSEALARRLITWRLAANDRVDKSILAPMVRDELRAEAETRIVRQLMSLGGSWGQTLDRFYLGQRMQNWVGNAASSVLPDYMPLFPFFDSAVVAAAMATPADQKLNSRAAYQLLVELDLALARRPLADGVVPAAIPSSRIGGKLMDLKLDIKRVTNRLHGHMTGGNRRTLGSQTIGQHWHRLGLYTRLPLDRLSRSGLFDDAALERIGSGRWLPDRPTLGFILMTAGLLSRP